MYGCVYLEELEEIKKQKTQGVLLLLHQIVFFSVQKNLQM